MKISKHFTIYVIFIFFFLIITKLKATKLTQEIFKSKFNSKSIYFSTLNNEKDFSIDNYNLNMEALKPHKTDTVIIKLDTGNTEDLDLRNSMSIQISHQYYNILSCFNSENLKNSYDNIFNKFVKFTQNNLSCYKHKDYFDKKSTRKLDNLNMNLLNREDYTVEEIKNDYYFSKLNLKKHINIDLVEYTSQIKYFFSDFIMWNEYTSFELSFVFNEESKTFVINKIFVYFSYPPYLYNTLEKTGKYYFITLIKNGLKLFDNIFIYYRNIQKLMKFTYNHRGEGKEKLSFVDFADTQLNYPVEVETKKYESLFHNILTLKFPLNLIDSYVKKLKLKLGNNNINDICFFVYQHLTEDTYVEKNELMNYLEEKHKDKILFHHSEFIEQELSSDLTEQFYTSFIVCDQISNFQNEFKYEIKYPIHFRYQPTLSKNIPTNHQNVFLPHPYIDILPKNNTVTIPELNVVLFEEYFYKNNVLEKENYFVKRKKSTNFKDEIYDERKMFFDEVISKYKYFINDYNLYTFNKENLQFLIPAGKQSHLTLVAIVTTIVSLVGFVIILYSLLIYSLKSSKKKNSINFNKIK
jgi:hypothetical protein